MFYRKSFGCDGMGAGVEPGGGLKVVELWGRVTHERNFNVNLRLNYLSDRFGLKT